jgi:hypothetical protein
MHGEIHAGLDRHRTDTARRQRKLPHGRPSQLIPPTGRISSICDDVRAADSSAAWTALSVSSMNGAIDSS